MKQSVRRNVVVSFRSRLAALVVLASFSLSLAGCYRAHIVGGTIYKPGFDPVSIAGKQERQVSHFEVSKRAGWFILALIPAMGPAGSDSDWSYERAINEINKRQGDAAKNIEVSSEWDIVDIIVSFFVGGLFNVSNYTMTGDVVKYQ